MLVQVGVNSVFQEVTLKMTVDEHERKWLLEQTSHVDEKDCTVTKLQTPAGNS